jgi:hypothetical protein
MSPDVMPVVCMVPSAMGIVQEFLLYVEQFRYAVGLLARQRRAELTRLNDQLRQINAALRRQAKIESYAPTLSYAPVGSKVQESDVIVDPQKERLIAYLRSGKNQLRNQAPDKAFPEFKAALDLAQSLSDHVEEKKAARGLGLFFHSWILMHIRHLVHYKCWLICGMMISMYGNTTLGKVVQMVANIDGLQQD